MNTRAIRRHHRQRLKRKRSTYFMCYDKSDRILIAKLVNTPKPCSCYACGNPRKHFKERTYQERRLKDDKRRI